MNDRPEELAVRCQLMKDLKGKVLELGYVRACVFSGACMHGARWNRRA